jgi:tetratricopeptide (TPR) repeat protein
MLQSNAEPEERPEAAKAAAEARAAADSGDWNAARAAMARAIDVSPNDPGFHAHMAWYSHQASALPAFERERLTEHHLSVALEIDPNNADAHYVQGMLWSSGGNTTRARIALTTALKVRPDYQAAEKALDRLDKVADPAPEQQMPGSSLPRSRAAKVRLPLIVASVLVTLVGVGAFLLSSDTHEMTSLASQLGTKLKIESASRVSQDLHIDVGASWEAMPEEDRSAELHAIAAHTGSLGLVNVFVYSRSAPVGETHEDKICLGPCSSPLAAMKGKRPPAKGTAKK